jgi:serine-type D-Ala-D-Ala carboxypeptidase/endopeptidase
MSILKHQFFSHRQIAFAFAVLLGIWVNVSTPFSAQAQDNPNIAGDYTGVLGPLHLKLHLEVAAAGEITGTLDSVDQGANSISCAEFHLDGQALTFSVPAVHGSWKGALSADGKTLTGTWDQGNPIQLVFSRDTFVPPAKPSRVDGIWLGTLQAGGTSLRIQLHVKGDNSGQEFCSLDSLDQHAMGLDCVKVTFSGDDFSFDVPVVTGHYAGKLSANGNALTGTWAQNGNSSPLTPTRQASEIVGKPVPPPSYDSAMAPVHAEDLQSVFDRDLAVALQSVNLRLQPVRASLSLCSIMECATSSVMV